MEKTLRVRGIVDVPIYEDDTIERVRELIAIGVESHPDRLFIQIRETLPDGYYATPREWSELVPTPLAGWTDRWRGRTSGVSQ